MKYRYTFLIILGNFILQSTILQNFRIFGVAPNTAMVIVIIFTILFGTAEGLKAGGTAGIIQDLFLSQAVGLNIFIYLSLAIIIGLIEERLFKDNFLTPFILVMVSTLYYHLLHFVIMLFLRNGNDLQYIIKESYLIEAILNSIICIIVYRRAFKRVYGYELR